MPLKITIICIGKIKERYIREGITEFLKRLRPFCNLAIVELKDKGIKKESEKIMKYAGSDTYVLDEKGKQYSSLEFSSLLKNGMDNQKEIIFVIGGHDGISEEIKRNAKLISLSKMTLLHELSRLILLEQIYRAYTIMHNRQYHK